MYPDQLGPVNPGDKLSAEEENILRQFATRRHTGHNTVSYSDGVAGAPPPIEHRIIWVRNNSAGDVTHGQYLCFSAVSANWQPGVGLSRFKVQAVYDGIEGTDGYESKYGVVLDEAIGSGGEGRCIVSGECSARIYVVDETDRFCDVDAATDTQHLVTADIGNAFILWKEAGEGLVWARLRLSNPPTPTSDAYPFLWRYFCMCQQMSMTGDPPDCADPVDVTRMDWNPAACGGLGQWECGEVEFQVHDVMGIFSHPVTILREGEYNCFRGWAIWVP